MSETIETRSLEGIIGRLTFEYPNLPQQVAHDLLVCAAQNVAEYGVLEHEIELGDELQANCQEYDYEHLIPEDLRLLKFVSVNFCNCCIYPVDPKCKMCPEGYEIIDHHCIKLWPNPTRLDKNSNLTICMMLEPTDTACNVPSILVDRYWKAMRDFARAEIALMKNEWYDPTYARQMKQKAEGAMRRVRSYKQRGEQEGFRTFTGERWA